MQKMSYDKYHSSSSHIKSTNPDCFYHVGVNLHIIEVPERTSIKLMIRLNECAIGIKIMMSFDAVFVVIQLKKTCIATKRMYVCLVNN